jgi:thiamine transport system permease protein
MTGRSGTDGRGVIPTRGSRFARVALAIIAAAVFAAVICSFLVPAVAAAVPAFSAGGSLSVVSTSSNETGSVAGGVASSPSFWPRIFSALRFTLTEALLSSLVAAIIGIPAAFLVARRRFPGRRLLLSLSGVPLCVPPVIIALAFVLFYGRQGYLNSFLMHAFGLATPPVTFLYSLAGVVIAHGFYNFPVVLRTLAQVWERLPEDEAEAALTLGASPARVFLTITLPRLSGAIFSSAVLVFLYCFFSFVIVLLFGGIGGTTLEVELYQAARATLDFRMAGVIAIVETVAAVGIVCLYAALQSRLSAGTEGVRPVRERLPLKGMGERIAAISFLFFILVFFIGPLVSILVRSFTVSPGGLYAAGVRPSLDPWLTLFGRGSFARAFASTLTVALAVAVISTLAGLFFALLEERRSARAFFRVVPLAPLAVSSVMLGFGWTILVPRGNVACLALAQSAIAWPFAWTQIRSSLDRIPRGVPEAASLLSPDGLDVDLRVRVPLAWKGILSGAGLVFAISAGDASLPLVLSLGRFENLALMLYRLVGSYRFAEACACAVVLALLSGFVFFLQERER